LTAYTTPETSSSTSSLGKKPVSTQNTFSQGFPKQQDLWHLLREVYPYFLTYAILERYVDLRRQLRPPQGKGLIGEIDTLIAATALERNLTILTADRDLKQVPRLKMQYL
jgi:predicted nucleic acid-binding protein